MTADPTLLSRINDPSRRADPYPLYRELRRDRVSFQETPDGHGTYVVSRYRDVVAVMQDPRLSSDARHGPAGAAAADPGRTFIEIDPPAHDRMRAIAMRHFGPPHRLDYIDWLIPAIVEMTDGLIDAMRGRAEVDVVADLAYALPVEVICRILGVTPEDEPEFSHWVDGIVNDTASTGDGAAARRDIAQYMGGLTSSGVATRARTCSPGWPPTPGRTGTGTTRH